MFTGIGGNKDLKQLQDLITAEKRIIDSSVNPSPVCHPPAH
jgi:hypothetical protein